MPSLQERYQKCESLVREFGQEHLLRFWPQLDERERRELLADIEQVDLPRCNLLIRTYVTSRPAFPLPERIEPPPIFPSAAAPEQVDMYQRARAVGESAIRAGKVAAFTVAGGQGTRLGFNGPKGAFRISPIRNASLFQWFAESLLGNRRRYGVLPRWYIMTSPTNHDDTIAFFRENAFFGLDADDVMFFQQGQMPAFLPDGRIALSARSRLALSPDGHGGSLRALAMSGALADMRARGIDYVSYFQVDNPLVRAIDPLFIGLHVETKSEISSKAVSKADDLERVGNFCLGDGKLRIIEYSDLPESLARAKNPDGSRRFDAGSIAIHVLTRAFIEALTAPHAKIELPWHRADKKAAIVNDAGEIVTPAEPNVVKLEMFVFDAIPLARQSIVLYTPRHEEFSPIKNAEGVDSPATARRDMIRRAARWLEHSGVAIPRDGRGEPRHALEISPAYALDAVDLRDRLNEGKPAIEGPLLLA